MVPIGMNKQMTELQVKSDHHTRQVGAIVGMMILMMMTTMMMILFMTMTMKSASVRECFNIDGHGKEAT